MKKMNAAALAEKKKLLKQLNKVDDLFSTLAKDPTLPTFVEHMALCIVLGTSQAVNLKAMYPKVHNKLSRLIQSSNN